LLIAELKGKISSQNEKSEDILTSNVFSYFKYSDRKILMDYLNELGIEVSLTDSKNAEFIFWPSYADGTEPDLIIVCGNYYLLFEAKYHSDFAPKTEKSESQIDREIKMGKIDAEKINKEFIYIAITAEYSKSKYKYSMFINNETRFIWTNWHFITSFIFNKMETVEFDADNQYSIDLYELLVKKKLRSFNGIMTIIYKPTNYDLEAIFYEVESSKYKGKFTGFLSNLDNFDLVDEYPIIFEKSFFKSFRIFEITNNDNIFYHERNTK